MDKHELPYIQKMFESIADRYDLLNRTLSLRQDILWRRKLVQMLNPSNNQCILDVASGTGDVAIAICKANPLAHVHCIDFSFNMLVQARSKKSSLNHKIDMTCADAFHLPYPENSFHAITMAFGIRNIVNKENLLNDLYKYLIPGGQILILELTLPDIDWLQKIYLMYFKRLLPIIGKMVSRNTFAYDYLPHSVISFPPSPNFSQMMQHAGFIQVKWLPMTAGVCTLFVGERPLYSCLK